MPTSATCHPPDRRRASGFTLIEVLVVLLLLALVAGVAFPRLERTYDAIRLSYEKDEVLAQIAELGYRAYRSGKGFQLGVATPEKDHAAPLSLPEGWRIEAKPPISYQSDGVCLGGVANLRRGEAVLTIELAPPYCQPRERP